MDTIIQLFEESVNKYSDNPLLWEKTSNEFESISYKETQKLVYEFAAGLLSLGVQKKDKIALLCEGRNNWIISELGVLYTGAVNVPLSVKLEAKTELLFRLNHSECSMVITSKNQSKKIQIIKDKLPSLKKIIYLDSLDEYKKNEIGFNEILKLGEDYLKTKFNEFEKNWKSIKPNDYANISYTSGTTADPKGIILSQQNYAANVEQAASLMYIPEHYRTLLILPLDHSFAHTAGIYSFMYYGASIATVQLGKSSLETLKNIPKNIKEIKPNILLSVPALAKNFKKNIEKGIHEKGSKVENLYNKAMKLAYAYNKEGWNRGKGLQILKKPLYAIYDKLIFSKIRENFGGELKFFIGGGALLDIELQKFFYAINMPMFQGYGLSEASPIISSNGLEKHKLGSSGYLVKNMELKICDGKGNTLPTGEKGEIVIKGDNVMVGYYKNEKSTKETIKDGWLYTGDLGYMDKDKFLYVLGRFKSLLISNDGEKFSPESIEEAFVQQSPFINQCMLHNDQNPYTVALFVTDKQAVLHYLTNNNLSADTEEGQKVALNKIQSEINEYRKGGKYKEMFPERWLPSAIAILEEAFSEENHFINSTVKMVRGKITKYYHKRIEYLYTPEAKNIHNDLNMKAIKILEEKRNLIAKEAKKEPVKAN
ncbi:MAG: AMP-binding protein [Bacteroidetes bacterium]|nr:AMP-binding protein [Bacteroidota bacterium]